MRLGWPWKQKASNMSAQLNSEEKKEAISKELSSLGLKNFRTSTHTETKAFDNYLAKFDKPQAMSLPSDRTLAATTRIMQTGYAPVVENRPPN